MNPSSRARAAGRMARRLDELGYAGWIGCEYKPSITGLGWMAPYRTAA